MIFKVIAFSLLAFFSAPTIAMDALKKITSEELEKKIIKAQIEKHIKDQITKRGLKLNQKNVDTIYSELVNNSIKANLATPLLDAEIKSIDQSLKTVLTEEESKTFKEQESEWYDRLESDIKEEIDTKRKTIEAQFADFFY